MKPTKIISVIIAAVLLCSLSSCAKVEPGVPEGCVEISAENIGYHFFMVEDWQVGEQNGMTSAMVSEFDTSNVSMMGFDAGEARSSEEYWAQFSEEFTTVLGEITYEEEGTDTTLGGKNAKKYIYTADIGGKTYKFMQIVCYLANAQMFTSQPEVYVFTYTAVPEKYDEHIEDVIYMADNIVFEE
ncbi:MAG: hypothetical protein IJ391_02510 [Clostridia bacterium]|nr:hypothetical protein [Clostridia bacterium]